jgi:hypothetical protein
MAPSATGGAISFSVKHNRRVKQIAGDRVLAVGIVGSNPVFYQHNVRDHEVQK